MTRFIRFSTFPLAVLSILATFCLARDAAAQQQGTSGPLVLEPLKNGAVVAPEVKITEFAGDVGTLVGAYGGYVNDDQLLIGGGGYWLVDGKNGREFGYGGAVIGWTMQPARAVSVGFRSLVGFGGTSQPVGVVYPAYPVYPPFGPFPTPINVHRIDNHYYGFHHGVFVAEPQVDVRMKLGDLVRVTAGIGYRAVNDWYSHNNGLGGVAGSFSVQFNFW
jgi:hypothetical protein